MLRTRTARVLAGAVSLLPLAGCATAAGVLPSPSVAPTPPARSSEVPASGAASTPSPARTSGGTTTDRPHPDGSAAAVLATLVVKGRAPMTGYDRDQFGQAWLDTNRNGCDTRNDVLARDLVARQIRPGTYGCVVESGDLADPYTGRPIHFVRGDGDLVDIDHVVALGNAWATGAFRWEIRKRAALANDPMNLLAVDASANRQKGDGDAATWLPVNKRYRCAYVARQVAVKAKYGLWVTPPERDAMERVLAGCPDRPVPPDSGAPVVAPVNVPTPGVARQSAAPAHDESTGGVYYANCDAARAAGAAPVRRGDPGYGPHLDRDGDGVACE